MSGPETNLTKRVLTELNSWPHTEAIKKHGGPYGKKGEPDIFGCRYGRMFLLEMKAPGKKPTKLQYKRLREWKESGAATGWSDTYEGAIEFVRSIQSSGPSGGET